jgi:hypothetical protein
MAQPLHRNIGHICKSYSHVTLQLFRIPAFRIGEPVDYLYPVDRYFDSASHLMMEWAAVYTRAIVEQLRPHLATTEFSTWDKR